MYLPCVLQTTNISASQLREWCLMKPLSCVTDCHFLAVSPRQKLPRSSLGLLLYWSFFCEEALFLSSNHFPKIVPVYSQVLWPGGLAFQHADFGNINIHFVSFSPKNMTSKYEYNSIKKTNISFVYFSCALVRLFPLIFVYYCEEQQAN